MNLASRIQRAETRVYGAELNPARVIEMAERDEFDLLTDAELDWLIAGGAPLAAETRAEIGGLFESLADEDLQAIIDARTLSREGRAIMARIERLTERAQ